MLFFYVVNAKCIQEIKQFYHRRKKDFFQLSTSVTCGSAFAKVLILSKNINNCSLGWTFVFGTQYRYNQVVQ